MCPVSVVKVLKLTSNSSVKQTSSLLVALFDSTPQTYYNSSILNKGIPDRKGV